MTVVVSNLTKRFRRGSETVTALTDVSLVVNPGELTVAAGPSGSGTTGRSGPARPARASPSPTLAGRPVAADLLGLADKRPQGLIACRP